jgi:hypothetical protein
MVDSNLKPKLPYYWIRQSQRDFALMAVRQELNGKAVLYAVNDTLKAQTGSYRITAYDTKGNASVFATGSFHAAPNSTTVISQLAEDGSQKLLVFEWTVNGSTHFNHFTTGTAPYPFEAWEKWNIILKKIFDADA